MITKEQAIESLRSTLDDDMDIMFDNIIEKDYGWVIFCQSKKFIETGDDGYILIGSGGTLVEREGGKHIEFGSAYSLEENLEIYEKGYLKYENWDLVITKVNDIQKTIDLLLTFGLSYVVPEEEHGAVWRIPRQYEQAELKRKLMQTPVRFNVGNLYLKYPELEEFKLQNAFTYDLVENDGFENSI